MFTMYLRLLTASGCAEGEHDIGLSFFPFPLSLASHFCHCSVELQLMALLVENLLGLDRKVKCNSSFGECHLFPLL